MNCDSSIVTGYDEDVVMGVVVDTLKAYNFQFDIESDYDLPGVTMKLTDSGDTNWFTEERHDVASGDVRRFTWKGVKTHEGADASAIRLFFDFGGSPAGAKVKISNIVFKEAQ